MKTIYSTIFACMLLTLGACSNSDTITDEPFAPNPAVDHITLDTPEDVVTIEASPVICKQIAGAGYDVRAPYLSQEAVKAPIIDIQKLKELGDYYSLMYATSSYSDIETFNTADLMPVSILANIKDDPWFSADNNHSSCFSFTYIATNFNYYIHRILLMDHMISNYPERIFSDDFLSDIKTMEPKDIILKYGTHVITSVSTGMRIGGLYRTAAFPPLSISGDQGPSAEAVCQHAAIQAMQKAYLPTNIQISGDTDSKKWHSDGALRVTLEGGNTSLLSANPTKEELNAWLTEGCTSENGAILGFSDDPKPIYELIPDKDKAIAVKKVFDQYMAYTLNVTKTAALLQSWENGQYKYSTTPTESTEGAVCAIPQRNGNGLTMLYSVTDGNKSRLMTGENGVPVPGKSLALGYIYSSPAAGTVPLYEYQCSGFYYYSLKDSNVSQTANNWSKTGILGYVIPLTVE